MRTMKSTFHEILLVWRMKMQMVLVMKLRLNVIKLTTMVMSLWILVVSKSQLIKLNLQLITVSLSSPNILMLLVGVSW